ncbi:putative repeat protein (TIGR01451 family) [Vibrio crassostreae]|nr:putative repeat protein (TIGR01451 family) [Vibrio crassostreae]CAK1741548.1 putative repeat protein (TIGR01451 family) [Vibrio crassostreae]CAK2260010.1 putative repeat protein (TIGR01451 family) [Vibrio crassostreae]CAK2280377.1 putative repeat protein (TIGR01451 family) [Vibrio crassostreae]CAK3065821.1 putative repeat protein (TIGR01451 family) [Vibrio crassostreae]
MAFRLETCQSTVKCALMFRYNLAFFLSILLFPFASYADTTGLVMDLSIDSASYDNDQQVVYTLVLTNESDRSIHDFDVKDELLDILTTDDKGNEVNAFTQASIQAEATLLSSPGTYDRLGNLEATDVRITAGGSVTYTMTATVSSDAAGSIDNVASASSGPLYSVESNTESIQRGLYEHDVVVSVDKTNYQLNKELTYSIKVSNTGDTVIRTLDIQDAISDIKTLDIDGVLQQAFTNNVNSAEVQGGESDAGNFSSSGDLSVTDASIDIGGSITYTIRTTVADKLVGDIVNDDITAETRDALVTGDAITTPPTAPNLTLKHTLNQTENYLVDDEFSYTVTVTNQENTGIAYRYSVQQLLADLETDLGNDISNDKNATDTTGNPYESWTNQVITIGPNSTSELAASGVESNHSLDDVVSIYPGEEILYSVEVDVSPVSIGEIHQVIARVLNAEGTADSADVVSNPLNTQDVLDSSSSQITRNKNTTDTTYVPGISGENEVVYDIVISNKDTEFFANDVEVIDKFACIVTEQADGSTDSAFSEWKLEVDESSGAGSNYGSFNYGAWTTNDINLKVDLAPEGFVHYKLTAKVADTSVGQIVDDGTDAGLCLGDNLGESGSGVQMPNSKLKVQKEVDSRYYSAGGTLNYEITVENNGDGYAIDVPVYDDIASIMTKSIKDEPTKAYLSWVVTAKSYGSDDLVSINSDPGFSGEIEGNQSNKNILDVKAKLAPHDKIIYSIAAVVNPIADDEIRNEVTVDSVLYSDRGSYPRDYYLVLDKRVDGNNEQNAYTDTTKEVTYTISVTNPEGNGFASNINIKDEISTIEAELLHEPGQTKPVFKSWTITADRDAASPWVKAVTDPGEFSDNTDLNATAQIPPGATITYTIVGTLDRDVDSEILWGTFTNTATVTGPDTNLSDTVRTYPSEPNLVVAKTAQNTDFVVGERSTFDIYIYNRGVGYANDATVKDSISALNFFDNWTVVGSTNTDEPGSRYGDIADNTDIETDVDITPGGWVHYEVTGVVKSDYEEDQVSNRVDVYDPITDRDHSSSAQIDNSNSAYDINVSLSKTTDVVRYTPGEDLTYTIVIGNNGDTDETDLIFMDRLSEITTTLANDKDGQVEDLIEQNPFEYWLVDPGTGTFGEKQTTDVEIPISVDAKDFVTVRIKARVKDNAVSNGVADRDGGIIRNEAVLIHDDDAGCAEDCEFAKRAVAENHQVHNNGTVVRTTNINRYSPGDELTYTITYNSQDGHGYRNNVGVNELINDISVELQDGTSGNPFFDDAVGTNKFTVAVAKSDPANAGTTDGTKDGEVVDDTNIVTSIDIDAGEDVTYTVTGTVRPDAVGDIYYRDTVVIPDDYHLDFDKTTDEVVYEPAQTVTYHLVIENDGKGNAHDIPIVDNLKDITVDLVDGTTGPAYSTWTITSIATGTDSEYVDAGAGAGKVYTSTDSNLNEEADIPMGATLEYQVVATINDKANGDVVNVLTVDGDTISHDIQQEARKIDFEKNILAYYDTDGNELAGATNYMPGGYVEYEILIENIASAHVDDMSLRDDIDQITTQYYDGTRGPAFDSWTIETSADRSGISDPDVDNSIKDNQPIDTHFDISADNFGRVVSSPFVRYVIKAKISPKAVGSFTNRAYIDEDDGNQFIAVSPPTSMSEPEITFSKRAFYDAGFSSAKTEYSQAVGESEVYYRVQIKNTGSGIEYGSRLEDTISAIQTRIAEDASTSGADPVGQPFLSGWEVQLEKTAAVGSITDAVDFVSGNNVDIDNDIVIAPQESLTFTIHAQIREDALGDIQNKATYDGSARAANLMPLENNTSVEKRVVSINGTPFSDGDTYLPGDEVEYEFVVTNPENGWANDIQIKDTVKDIQVEVIGGKMESAFVSGDITHEVSNGIDANVDTYVPSYNPNNNLNIETDIAAGEVLTFNLTGVIRDDALGTIEANRVTAENESATSETIPPQAAELDYFKTLVYTDGESAGCSVPSNDGSSCTYAPRGDVEYQVTLDNTGDSIANDVRVIDAIHTIKTEDGDDAFSDWATAIAVEPVGTYDVQGNYNGSVPLNATVDLRPGERIVFDVKGTVSTSATGTITNTAQVNGDDTNDIVLDPGRSNILIDKWTDTPTYVPGGTVNYYIDITNDDVDSGLFSIRDIISGFEVETVDGSMQAALTEWSVDYDVLYNSAPSDPDANDFSELDKLVGQSSPDIDLPAESVKMAGRDDAGTGGGDKYTVVRIHVEGKVRDDAIGRFTNTAYLRHGLDDSKIARLREGYITPQPGQLVLTKETTPITEPDAKYQPGQPISYKITVANTGEGYLVDQVLTDRIDTIMTEVANSPDQEQALTGNWVISDEQIDDSGDPALNARKDVSNTTQGYSATYSIHPGDSYSFVVTNTVNDKAKGEITNVVKVASDDGEYTAEATYIPEDAQVEITKDVDKAEYLPGETLQYTVTVKNNGLGWAEDVAIEDALKSIETMIAGGETKQAFDPASIQISAVSTTGETPVPGATSGEDLNETLDIAPEDSIVFTIQVTTNALATGDITNMTSATFDGTTFNDSATSTPVLATVSIDKIVDTSSYEVTKLVNYEVTVTNSSDAFASDVQLQDIISDIEVDTTADKKESAFLMWEVSFEASDDRTVVTPKTFELSEDIDVNMDVAPQSTVTFHVKALIRTTAIGDISNTATITYNGTPQDSTVVMTPKDSEFVATKTNVQTEYEPGGELEFLITIENTSNNYISDLSVVDDMSTIEVSYYDGTTGPAFVAGTTSLVVESTTVGTTTEQISPIEYSVDIAPHGTVVFRSKGTVVDTATGRIINTAQVDGGDVISPPVNTVAAVVQAELYTDAPYYVPGEQVEYHLVVQNIGRGIAKDVALYTQFSESMGDYIDGSRSNAFDDWTLTASSEGAETQPGTFDNDKDLFTLVDIAPGGKIDYTFTLTVNEDMLTNIDVLGYYLDLTGSPTMRARSKGMLASETSMQAVADQVSALDLPPVGADLIVEKRSDKPEYTEDDDSVTYYLAVTNNGLGNAANVRLTDEISELQNSVGNKVFTDWTIEGVEVDDTGAVIQRHSFPSSKDLDTTVNLKSQKRNAYAFEVVGTLGKGLDDDITNTFTATESDGTETSDSVTTHIKKIPDNSGELELTKSALQDTVQVGDAVEYEIIVENNNESYFKNVTVEDRYPGGLKYIVDTSEVVLSGIDGEFGTEDDQVISQEPSDTGKLMFTSLNFDPGEKLRIRYLLRVSVGATFGDYVNTAVAKVDGSAVSNEDTAKVTVEPDKVFDTSSIIGKVFEDHNKDGFQADATAFDVELTANLTTQGYIADSTHIIRDGQDVAVKDGAITNALEQGLDLGDLWGHSVNRTLPETSKVVIQFKTRTQQSFDFYVTTDAGSRIEFDAQGQIQFKHESDKKKGLSAENLNVTRNLYRDGEDYLWEIVIENKGIYEDGIPGVKLMTVEGIVIYTDQYGRYHVPDQWVLSKKGKNFLVKLDTDSLSTSMEVVSENPKVLRITPNKLTKFNFSVHRKDQQSEQK